MIILLLIILLFIAICKARGETLKQITIELLGIALVSAIMGGLLK